MEPADYETLHRIRLRHPLPDDSAAVEELLARELVVDRDGMISLTRAGNDAFESWARVEDERREAVEQAYAEFRVLNDALLEIVSAWQLLPGGVPNTHEDATYDWEIIDRLTAHDQRVRPVIRRLARSVPRFELYPDALRHAVRRLNEGDTEWLLSLRQDSYHTVWMRLHEDLLLALGMTRRDESTREGQGEAGSIP